MAEDLRILNQRREEVGTETILVVDSESVFRELLTQTLESEGYCVLSADSGEVALASVLAQPPDLILSDLRMPGLDGFEFRRQFRAMSESVSIPLIFMSAATDTKARVEGLALGAVDFISKPFQREELLARVSTHLELGRLRGHLAAQVTRRTEELHAVLLRLQREIANRERAEEELMESEKRFRVLAGGIAHDFTNLMGSILAIAELAETEIAEGSSPGEEIQTIKTVASHASEMSRELMTYAGKDRTTVEFLGKIGLIDLSQLVEGMADILKNSISKRCTLKSDLPKKLPRILSNPIHIRQIVMNLIINASEAVGDATGTIYLRISRATDGQCSGLECCNLLPGGNYLRLEVSDTGCGMTNEQQTHIFDPFFTTKRRGSGLGLVVVKRIVQLYGGAINVASQPGQGTTFEILFPCVEERAAKAAFSVRQAASEIPAPTEKVDRSLYKSSLRLRSEMLNS